MIGAACMMESSTDTNNDSNSPSVRLGKRMSAYDDDV